jgi:ATP-binding cassette subfamily C (CFTR/MRP) protein 1
VLQLVILILWAAANSHRTPASIPVGFLSLISSLAICVLSYVEHCRSIRPSTLLNIYLFFALIPNAIQLRTLYLRDSTSTIFHVSLASAIITLFLLVLEAQAKTKYLKREFQGQAPEAVSGFWNRSFFWWINPLLVTGYYNILTLDNLPRLDPSMSSETLRVRMQASWDKRRRL